MDSLRIYIVSYNVACKPPEESLDELLALEESEEKLPDLYVVGLQEVKAQVYNIVVDALLDDPWTIAFKQFVISYRFNKPEGRVELMSRQQLAGVEVYPKTSLPRKYHQGTTGRLTMVKIGLRLTLTLLSDSFRMTDFRERKVDVKGVDDDSECGKIDEAEQQCVGGGTTTKMKLRTKNYVKLKTIRLQGLILSIYSKRKHLLNIRDVEMQYTKTGLGGFWGNKGAVALRMNVYGVSVCVVNTHLTPHDQNLQARIQDYNHIVSEMHFARQTETSLIFYHDYVFWLGDHNFRIDEAISHEEILDKIKAKKLDWLKNVDQLKCIMRSGQAFSELTEEPFYFPPTYKYIFRTSDYDPKRRPAWTDRILYRVNANAYENLTLSAKMQFYKSFPNYTVSDHKPIAGEFIFKVFSDYSDRVIEFSPIKKWYINEENIVSFVAEDVQITDWDWIGIFKYNFCALDEYVSFVYVNTVSPSRQQLTTSPSTFGSSSSSSSRSRKEVKFPDGMVRREGSYCLLYLTADSGSVLGMSPVFEAEFKTGDAGCEMDAEEIKSKTVEFLKDARGW